MDSSLSKESHITSVRLGLGSHFCSRWTSSSERRLSPWQRRELMDNAYLTDPSQADYCLLVDISCSVGACRQGSACHDTPGSWLKWLHFSVLIYCVVIFFWQQYFLCFQVLEGISRCYLNMFLVTSFLFLLINIFTLFTRKVQLLRLPCWVN